MTVYTSSGTPIGSRPGSDAIAPVSITPPVFQYFAAREIDGIAFAAGVYVDGDVPALPAGAAMWVVQAEDKQRRFTDAGHYSIQFPESSEQPLRTVAIWALDASGLPMQVYYDKLEQPIPPTTEEPITLTPLTLTWGDNLTSTDVSEHPGYRSALILVAPTDAAFAVGEAAAPLGEIAWAKVGAGVVQGDPFTAYEATKVMRYLGLDGDGNKLWRLDILEGDPHYPTGHYRQSGQQFGGFVTAWRTAPGEPWSGVSGPVTWFADPPPGEEEPTTLAKPEPVATWSITPGAADGEAVYAITAISDWGDATVIGDNAGTPGTYETIPCDSAGNVLDGFSWQTIADGGSLTFAALAGSTSFYALLRPRNGEGIAGDTTQRGPITLPGEVVSPPGEYEPPAAVPASTTNRTSVTQRGVTFTFNKAMPCGQYANGDWFVRSTEAFTITSSPGWTGSRHGAQWNPSHPADHGYDSRAGFARDTLNTAPRYVASLNVGDSAFSVSAGQEGSYVKAVSDAGTSDDSHLDDLVILTVVNSIPASDAFRPSPFGSGSRASAWRTGHIDLGKFPTATIANMSEISLSRALQAVHGPWPCWCLGSRAFRSYCADNITYQRSDGFYGPWIGFELMHALAFIFHSGTSEADRRELINRIVQIGIDSAQASIRVGSMPTAFWSYIQAWPAFFAVAALGDFGTDLKPGLGSGASTSADRWSVYLLDDGTRQYPLISSSDFGRVPDSGGTQNQTYWPMALPFTSEMVGIPDFGRSNGRSGFHGHINNWYSKARGVQLYLYGALFFIRGGDSAVNEPTRLRAMDRIARVYRGHYAGDWDYNTTSGTSYDFTQGAFQWSWLRPHLSVWEQLRSTVAQPEWTGQPEQMSPPILSRPAAGQLRVRMTPYRPDNGHPITEIQIRYRRISSANDANVYGSAAWTTITRPADDFDHTITGLTAGVYQVQIRAVNSAGNGAWSTNIPWRSDKGSYSGVTSPFGGTMTIPAGYRAVETV